jgi:hypothetical protein
MAMIAVIALGLGGLVLAERSGALWWASQALECSVFFFPWFSVAAGAVLLVALVVAARDRRMWRMRSLWLLLPLLVPVALLSFGIAFRYDGAPDATIEARKHIVEWSPWFVVPIGVVLLACFRSVSYWLMICAISILAFWLSLGAAVMSWMSVTNVWL